MTDRLATGYQPNFDIDAEIGRQGELIVWDYIESLRNGASVEVKTDERFAETGKIYLEFECRGVPSGFATTNAELWCHVLGASHQASVLIWDVAQLRRACRALYKDSQDGQDGYVKECKRGSHPTRGICAPLLTFLHYYREAGAIAEPIAA